MRITPPGAVPPLPRWALRGYLRREWQVIVPALASLVIGMAFHQLISLLLGGALLCYVAGGYDGFWWKLTAEWYAQAVDNLLRERGA